MHILLCDDDESTLTQLATPSGQEYTAYLARRRYRISKIGDCSIQYPSPKTAPLRELFSANFSSAKIGMEILNRSCKRA